MKPRIRIYYGGQLLRNLVINFGDQKIMPLLKGAIYHRLARVYKPCDGVVFLVVQGEPVTLYLTLERG